MAVMRLRFSSFVLCSSISISSSFTFNRSFSLERFSIVSNYPGLLVGLVLENADFSSTITLIGCTDTCLRCPPRLVEGRRRLTVPFKTGSKQV